MDDINDVFPDKTLGFGYRKDASLRKEGDDWLIDYENEGELVYRIRLGARCDLEEHHGDGQTSHTTHSSLGKAFLHHGLAVYGFGRRNGLPAWEERLLSRLPEGSYGLVFSPKWVKEPIELYYPDGLLRRILIPAWSDPKGLVQVLTELGVPRTACLEIPDATLLTEDHGGGQEAQPCYLVHAVGFAREVVPILRELARRGLIGPGVPRRPILLYAHGLRWPETLWFPGEEGGPVRRYGFTLPRGLAKVYTERLEAASAGKVPPAADGLQVEGGAR